MAESTEPTMLIAWIVFGLVLFNFVRAEITLCSDFIFLLDHHLKIREAVFYQLGLITTIGCYFAGVLSNGWRNLRNTLRTWTALYLSMAVLFLLASLPTARRVAEAVAHARSLQ